MNGFRLMIDKFSMVMNTVGAHSGFDQQLGFSRSSPVYLDVAQNDQHLNPWENSFCRITYQVILTASGWPIPFKLLMTALMLMSEEVVDLFAGFESDSEVFAYLYERLVTLTGSHPSRRSNV
jgi:hypothetical protein